MNILLPLGLLALIGIPILIIIYIIKPKFQEKAVSSTYIWKLSLKYKKRKLPIQWLQKSLLFFIQVLVIAILSLCIARPFIYVAANDGEKVIILDASASMNGKTNGKSRFERAISEIEALINKVDTENKMTIILAGDEPSYLARREDSVNYLKYVLSSVTSTYEQCNIEGALVLANSVIDENPSTEVIFYTDYNYVSSGYVTLENVAKDEQNVAILDFTATLDRGYYTFKSKVASYNKNKDIKLVLNVDNKTIEQNLSLSRNHVLEITLSELEILAYEKATLSILEQDNKAINDALEEDNYMNLTNIDNRKFKVQLISESITFMSAALSSIQNCEVTNPQTVAEIKTTGQDLYIYDGYLPEVIPEDGAVWIINPPKSSEKLGFEVGSKIDGDFSFTSTGLNTETYNTIMKYIYPAIIEATQYTEISNITNYEVLMTVNNSPAVIAGVVERAKVVVFAFDLGFTTLPVSFNMAPLINNMLDFSVAHTTEKSLYFVGETATINVLPKTISLEINDEVIMNDYNYSDKNDYLLTTPGVYTIKQTFADNTERVEQIYVRIVESESDFSIRGDILTVDQYINPSTGVVGTPRHNFDPKEIIIYLTAALFVLIIIEWGVQYREQY